MIKTIHRKLSSLKVVWTFLSNFGPATTFKIFLGTWDKIALKHPVLKHEFWIRPGTSDVSIFYEVIIKNGYKVPKNMNPSFIVDLGANIGDTAAYFASLFPGATVVAIEPEESNFRLLRDNTSKYQNVYCLKQAIWNKQSSAKITNLKEDDKWAFQVGKSVSHSERNNSIKTVTVDEIMKKYNKKTIDLLKIDIEGSEKELFTSNYSNWLPNTKFIFIELHDRLRRGCTQKFLNAINEFNFSLVRINDCEAIAQNMNFAIGA